MLRAGILFSVILLLSGCTNADQKDEVSALSEGESKWSETALYDLKITDGDATSWGFLNPKQDLLSTKTYASPNRYAIESELLSVVPEYCTPVALILEGGKGSGAEYWFYQIFSTNDSRFAILQIQVQTYPAIGVAKKKFDEFLKLMDKCGAYIPTYGDSRKSLGTEVLRWKEISEYGSDYVIFDNPNDYSVYVGVKESAIFSIQVNMDLSAALRQKILIKGSNQLKTKLSDIQGPIEDPSSDGL
jgi:hypothetical protein